MNEATYTIQELSELTGVPRRTVHFYTQQGILPPPSGAGLGARYGQEHLVRLRLVPVLRRQGLRLDDIRARFDNLSLDEMKEVLSSRRAPAVSAQRLLTVPSPEPPAAFNLYQLPAGAMLLIPSQLAPADREKLSNRLKTVAQIFGYTSSHLDEGENHE